MGVLEPDGRSGSPSVGSCLRGYPFPLPSGLSLSDCPCAVTAPHSNAVPTLRCYCPLTGQRGGPGFSEPRPFLFLPLTGVRRLFPVDILLISVDNRHLAKLTGVLI